MNLRDDVEVDADLVERLARYFRLLGVGPADACALDTARSGMTVGPLVWREVETLTMTAAVLAESERGREAAEVIRRLRANVERLAALVGDAA